jgi:hypothetical protein
MVSRGAVNSAAEDGGFREARHKQQLEPWRADTRLVSLSVYPVRGERWHTDRVGSVTPGRSAARWLARCLSDRMRLWICRRVSGLGHRAGVPAPRRGKEEPGRAEGAARPEPGDHGLGRSRGWLTTKFHLAVDQDQKALAVIAAAGQRGDSRSSSPCWRRSASRGCTAAGPA